MRIPHAGQAAAGSPWLWLLLGIALLQGCVSPAPQPVGYGDFISAIRLHDWQLRGKLGLRFDDRAISATINWTQSGPGYDIYLSGPMGSGNVRIRGDAGEVELIRGGEAPTRASNAEQLLHSQLGWWLPISDLHYWVRGLVAPIPGSNAQTRDSDGTLQNLEQSGWQLAYTGYSEVSSYRLPTRIVMQHGSVKATLVVKNWRILQ